MNGSSSYLVLFVTIGLMVDGHHGYKVLGIFPTMAKSHFVVGSAVMRGLAEKGHEVTVISPFPQKNPMENWRDIPTTDIIERSKGIMNNVLDFRNEGPFEMFMNLFTMGEMITNSTLHEKNVVKLLQSGEKFDVVVMEVFANEAMLGFAQHFKAPVVGVSTFGANLWVNEMVGSPSPPSYVPTPFSSFNDKMNFVERLGNLAMIMIERMFYNYYHLPKQIALYNNRFKDAKTSLPDLIRNVSLVLLNSHVSLSYPRPYSINMIEVGGMHIDRKTKPLPAHMKEFLDSAKDGAIYFSMGSIIRGKLLHKEKVEAILKVFGSLKQKVLWKWEDPVLPGKPDNVLISDWFPQNDILSHPNIKLFITHGGLLSTTESVYFGVPIIAIPIFGDQPLNAARAEKAGMGRKLDYNSLNEDTFRSVIQEILGKRSFYADNVKKMSIRYRDQPQPPLDTAVYWIEFVARHKGAVHLHSAGQDLNFMQYHNLDIYAFVIGLMFLLAYLTKKLFKVICKTSKKDDFKRKAE